MTSILLVDDHAALSAAMAAALRSAGFGPADALDVVGANEDEIVDAVIAAGRDVVLLDIHLDNGRLSHDLVPPIVAGGSKVIVFSASGSRDLIGAAVRNGAVGVIEKSASFADVVAAIARVASGEHLMSESERAECVAHAEARGDLDRIRAAFASLTPSESLALHSLTLGHSPKEIAASEHLSVATVRGHIEHALRKLGVSGQRQALAAARSIGWPAGDSASP